MLWSAKIVVRLWFCVGACIDWLLEEIAYLEEEESGSLDSQDNRAEGAYLESTGAPDLYKQIIDLLLKCEFLIVEVIQIHRLHNVNLGLAVTEVWGCERHSRLVIIATLMQLLVLAVEILLNHL